MIRYLMAGFMLIGSLAISSDLQATPIPVIYEYDATISGYDVDTEEYLTFTGKAQVFWHGFLVEADFPDFIKAVAGTISSASLGLSGSVGMQGSDTDLSLNDSYFWRMGAGSPYHVSEPPGCIKKGEI